MSEESRRILINTIRATIQRLERDPEVRADDPAFDILKGLLLRNIAEIEKPQEEAPLILTIPETVE